MACATCHREIEDFSVYCPHCGAQVEGAQECTDTHTKRSSTTVKRVLIDSYACGNNDNRLHAETDDIVWQGDNRVVLLDKGSLSTLREVPAAENNAIDYACLASGTILVCERNARYMGVRGRYRLVDKSTGEDAPSDIQSYLYYVSLASISDVNTITRRMDTADAQPVLDIAHERMAVLCADTHIRVFSLSDGKEVWQPPGGYTHLAFLHFTDSGDLLIQDEEGCFSLLASGDGAVVSSSLLELPPIEKYIQTYKDGIVVEHAVSSTNRARGVALIAIDRNSFGPLWTCRLVSRLQRITPGIFPMMVRATSCTTRHPSMSIGSSMRQALSSKSTS